MKQPSSLEEQEEVGSYFSMSVWTLPFQEAICSARSAMASASWGGGGTELRTVAFAWTRKCVCRPAHLCDDDGRQVLQVLDVGEQGVPQGGVGLGRELVEGRLDLHLHGLSSKVTRLHVLFELQQLV